MLTRTPETRASVLSKMRQSVVKRLEPLGALLVSEREVAHEELAVATALRQQLEGPVAPSLLLVSGAAATVDRADVVPAAIVGAGGRVIHAGMPVDPGNLLVLGEIPVGRGHGAGGGNSRPARVRRNSMALISCCGDWWPESASRARTSWPWVSAGC